MNTGVATEIYEKINWVRFGKRTQFWGGILVGLDAAKRKTNPLLGVSEWWRQAERWLYRPIL